MRIFDLSDEHVPLYLACLKDWGKSEGIEGIKQAWYERMRPRGLRVKLAADDAGVVGGMIQYVPIKYSNALGDDLYFVQCTWVHGYKEGRGNFQGRGMGKALLAAAEDDARALGAKGMAAWGIAFPWWLPVAWYVKQGYTETDRIGGRVLVWKPFAADAEPPRWMRQSKTPTPVPGKVTITAFLNAWCGAACASFDHARRAAEALGDKVVFRAIDTSDPEVMHEWGIQNAVFVNETELSGGPAKSCEEFVQILREHIAKK